MELDSLADQIVEAMVRRAEEDSGMTMDEVQRLLVMRVQAEAARTGTPPRELMRAVWQSWERHNRPPMLGEEESNRIVDSLVRKGFLQREERPGAPPVIRWGTLSPAEAEKKMPELTHEEQLFVRGILRYLQRQSPPAA